MHLTPGAVLFPFQHAGSFFTYSGLFPSPPKVKACTFDPFPASCRGLLLPEDALVIASAGWGAEAEGRKEKDSVLRV